MKKIDVLKWVSVGLNIVAGTIWLVMAVRENPIYLFMGIFHFCVALWVGR